MSEKKLRKLLSKIENASNVFDGLCQDLSSCIQYNIEFECHVTEVGGDGIVIGDSNGNVAPAIDVIVFISRNKMMSHSDFKDLCI